MVIIAFLFSFIEGEAGTLRRVPILPQIDKIHCLIPIIPIISISVLQVIKLLENKFLM